MEKLLIPRMEAADVLSISLKKLDELSNRGAIRRLYIGTRVMYTPDALLDFVTRLSERGDDRTC